MGLKRIKKITGPAPVQIVTGLHFYFGDHSPVYHHPIFGAVELYEKKRIPIGEYKALLKQKKPLPGILKLPLREEFRDWHLLRA